MATEKEKMLAGEPYIASDAELTRERRHAREVLHGFNGAAPGRTRRPCARWRGSSARSARGRW